VVGHDGLVSVPPVKLPEPVEPLLPGSVEKHLVTRVPVCRPDATAGQVQAMLLRHPFDSAVDVAVCEESPAGERLLGLVRIETVLAAGPDEVVGPLMDADPPVVAPGTNQEEAAWKAARHGESSLAVVDDVGTFAGLVPPQDLLRVLLVHHDRDLARLSGVLETTAEARHAMQEPMAARLWHRIPWLLLGLLGSAAAALLVQGFEADLSRDVRLAFFIPGIVYMADAVGTQTEALVIRGLSVGFPIRRVFRLESLTGLLVGVFLGLVSLPTIWLVLGSFPLALTVSLALVVACAVASVIAMTLPWLMWRLGRDPAFGSGPLATVLQDLLSLVVYFLIAAAVLG
jgi:magnesium transporter